MPIRPLCRDQVWLFPPSVDELVPADHPARFVAAFVDSLDRVELLKLGIDPAGDQLGTASHSPRALLGAWLYGFLSGIRSSRKLELACREQIPFLWISGLQTPDHNTLWRFYKAHRLQMRKLLKRTVRTAVRVGLAELAFQAIDGSKIAANAAKGRTYDEKGLNKLLERTDKAIAELEAQNVTGGPKALRLPKELEKAKVLKKKVEEALEKVKAEEGPREINLTDEDASIVKGRGGQSPGYNAQAAVVGLDEEVAKGKGMLIAAVEVVKEADDHEQLLPMLQRAEEMVGERVEVSLFDGGYHSGANLEKVEERGYRVLMAESQRKELKSPFHKDNFTYDATSDSYVCPKGQALTHRTNKKRSDGGEAKVYRGKAKVCRECEWVGECTENKRQGRSVEVGPYEEKLRKHRELMGKEESKETYKLRKQTVEPVFGIMKEVQGARRFLLRGLEDVRSEWTLLATAFNLKSLWRVWRRGGLGMEMVWDEM